jgi:ribosomal protein L11 methylase PrmA
LPLKSRLNLGVWLHVYLQNTTMINDKGSKSQVRFSKKKLTDLISHLETIIRNFPADKPFKTTWSNYYDDTRLSKEYVDEKEKIVLEMCGQTGAKTVLDLGANTGHFSKKLASLGMTVVATDTDSRCINKLYLDTTKNSALNILPLVVDVANPSPAIGFNNRERAAFHDRIQTELVLALALIHHLVIGRNIPLPALAAYFHRVSPQLIIEFPPKKDEKVKQMLSSRPDIFMDYDQEHFETAFSTYFTIADQIKIPGTERILYRMIRK